MLSLQKNKQMKKYSDWFKVDLRIHTDQKYNEGFDRLKTLDFQKKDDIPYINFSDNHNCNKYPCNNKTDENHQFYCIKVNSRLSPFVLLL